MPPAAPTSTARVLVVEDEDDIAQLIKGTLERGGEMAVDTVGTGDAALKAIIDRAPDLVILDLNLPVMDGLEVYRILRLRDDTAETPVIMLTARASEAHRVQGLELGAEDYVTKPFSLAELRARVRSVLRRRQRDAAGQRGVPQVFQGRHLSADFDAVDVRVNGMPVRLTRREFDLLRFLVENRNRVVSRERLLSRVWGCDAAIETRSVDVHVGRLRAKLGPAGAQIETHIGLGYRFAE